MEKKEFYELLSELLECKNEEGELLATLYDVDFIKMSTGVILSGDTFYERAREIDNKLQ